MPIATRKQETIRHELKTLPEAFVVLRQLSYDEMLERRDGATQVLMERSQGGRSRVDAQMSIKIANRWSNEFSFPRCIVDHNLTDEKGVPLDFSRPKEVFRFLDPKVGSEIENLIDELNQEQEDTEDFIRSLDSSSPNENGLPQTPSDPS